MPSGSLACTTSVFGFAFTSSLGLPYLSPSSRPTEIARLGFSAKVSRGLLRYMCVRAFTCS